MTDAARPTHIRYVILGLTTLVAVTLYLDRYCFGFVAQDIRDQLRLAQTEIDWLQGAFFYAYAFGQLPCGWLSDRFGQRAMLALYLFSWSLLTGMMGLAMSFGALLAFRLGCGLFEAGAYPACAGLIRRWVPYHQRGLASGIVSIGGRIGGAIAFPLTAYLMVAFTPPSASSYFTAADLIDPRGLAEQLLHPEVAPEGTLARQLAERCRPLLSVGDQQFLQSLADRPAGAVTATDQGRLLEVANALLRRPDLATGLDLTPFAAKLPPEVQAAPPSSSTTEPDVTRRNRLLVEVALADRGEQLPKLVCKIYGWGWRPTVVVFGAAGVMLAGAFWLFFRNRPRQHPLVNAAEAGLIEAGAGPADASEAAVPAGQLWYYIVTNVSLWLSAVVQFGTNFGWVFLGTKLSEYLERVHQVPKIEQGWMVGLPFFVSLPMMIVGGWWTDAMTRRWGRRLGRAFPILSTRFLAAGAFLACVVLRAPWPVTLALCVVSVASDMGLPALWAYNLDVGGRNVGLVLGWGNMWGNLGAAVSPYVLGRIQEAYGWDAVFVACAVVFVVIGVASVGIDATHPVVRAEGRAT